MTDTSEADANVWLRLSPEASRDLTEDQRAEYLAWLGSHHEGYTDGFLHHPASGRSVLLVCSEHRVASEIELVVSWQPPADPEIVKLNRAMWDKSPMPEFLRPLLVPVEPGETFVFHHEPHRSFAAVDLYTPGTRPIPEGGAAE